MPNPIFPHIKKSIEDFVSEQDGNIPRNKVLTIGTMLMILGILMTDDAFAAHRSHSSHKSHSSHSSHSSGSGGHSSHESHQSHQSHTSSTGSTHGNAATYHSNAAPHSNHSNHASHANDGPSLNVLNNTRTPQSVDIAAIGAKANLAAAGETLPETTPVDVD